MGRRKKTDWFEDACAHVVGEIAKGVGKRLRTAIETPKLASQAPFQATKPAVAPPTINVFQGPTQVVVNKRRRSSVAGSRKKQSPKTDRRRPTTDAIDVEFKVKP